MTPTDPVNVANELQRGLYLLSVATIALYCIVAAAIFFIWSDLDGKRHELRQEENRTTAALCALRHDLETRVASSEAFLVEHPNGIPGVPVAVIRNGLGNQKQTIKALAIVRCDAAPTTTTDTTTTTVK